MKFAIVSTEATGLSWWKRLVDEGHDVLVYIEPKGHKLVGDGIVPKTNNYSNLVDFGRGGVYFFDAGGQGDKADLLRRAGEKVVGGGKLCDKLEKERGWASGLIESTGVKAPLTREFSSISQAIAHAKTKDKTWVFKSNKYLTSSSTYRSKDAEDLVKYLEYIRSHYGDNIPCLLQEAMDGIALSTARWWNGHDWTGPYEGTIEHKKFLSKDIGPATGCAFNLVWFYQGDDPEIAQKLHFKELGQILRKEQAPPGIYDINAMLSKVDGEPYFLEFTPRLGYDSETTSQQGITDLGKLLATLAEGGDASELFKVGPVYSSIRLSISPYPFEAVDHIPEKDDCLDVPVLGADGIWSKHFIGYGVRYDSKLGLVCADPTGLIGLSAATGKTPDLAFKKCYDFIEHTDFIVPNLQYRPDAEECVVKDISTMMQLGYDSYF